MTRLFVALRPPSALRNSLLDTMDAVEGARWQNEHQFHLTLRFVGEVDPPMADDLAAALGAIEAPGFTLTFNGIGHFEKKGRPTSLWARSAPSAALADLQRKVERACRRAGLEPEHRKFIPHVTLARLGRTPEPIGGWLAEHGALKAGPWPVGEFRLYQSTLTPGGAQYDPVVSYRLHR